MSGVGVLVLVEQHRFVSRCDPLADLGVFGDHLMGAPDEITEVGDAEPAFLVVVRNEGRQHLDSLMPRTVRIGLEPGRGCHGGGMHEIVGQLS